jgi:arylformamidase
MRTMTWLDISVPIRSEMFTFDGDPTVHLERASSMSAGAVCNISRLDFGVHSGTHVDAPVHFIDGAAGIETVPLDALVGPAMVIDATSVEDRLDRTAIDGLAIPAGTERVLFRTRNTDLWGRPTFSTGFVALTADGARALIERDVRLVGADYLSIALYGDPVDTHVALLGASVVIVEGLDLRAVEPGPYDLICLPLLIPGSDGGPARAIVRRRNA